MLSRNLLCLVLFMPIFKSVAQLNQPSPPDAALVICRPFGACERCPTDAREDASCEPTGNRRLLRCHPRSSLDSLGKSQPPHEDTPAETSSWEPCGKIIATERADYWEFVTCNIIFAGVGLLVVFSRTRRIAAIQYKNLVARIGLARGAAGVGWTSG
ncbi:hypothetical protein BS47DRAFT_1200822 [Hydnum rufescens UP504]|uniref:Uncharacterized protein n=1 Tax=Hydnum rufescens UP504 TaxID=1448309 RepID=A0A9P6DRG7_9AGAM|nr:hypothetical protein BS47DRAFT_1200822 [Hydnum rufescens UP504]